MGVEAVAESLIAVAPQADGRKGPLTPEGAALLARTLGAANIGFDEVKGAAQTMFQPGMKPADRSAAIAKATTPDNLAESMTCFVEQAAAAIPEGTLSMLAGAVPPNSGGTEIWSGVGAKLPHIAERLEALLREPRSDDIQNRIETAATLLSAAAAVEKKNLSQLAFHLPPEKQETFHAALIDYCVGVAALLENQSGGPVDTAPLPDVFRQQGAKALQGLLRPDAGAVTEADLLALVDVLVPVGKLIPAAMRATKGLGRNGAAELERLNGALKVAVSDAVAQSPESAHALDEIIKDTCAGFKFAQNMKVVLRVINTKEIPDREAAIVEIQQAVERMPRPFLKWLQALGNDTENEETIAALKKQAPNADLLLEVAARVKDRVSKMTEAEMRAQMLEAFPDTKDPVNFSDYFEEVDWRPYYAASVGQTIRTKVLDPDNAGQIVSSCTKIQRFGVLEDVDEGRRIFRIGFDMLGVLVSSSATSEMAEQLNGLLGFCKRSMASVLDTFAVEADYPNEAKNIVAARENSRSHEGIYVHRVFAKQTKGPVLTTEFVHGWSLDIYVKRFNCSQKALKETYVPPDNATPEAIARGRADLYCRQVYGASPDPKQLEIKRTNTGNGWEIRAYFNDAKMPEFHDAAYPVLDLVVSDAGNVHCDEQKPDLSPKAVAKVRTRIFSDFVSQVFFHRRAHADMQTGNFKVLRDGVTVALIDFGQVVVIGLRHFFAPAKAIWAAYHDDKRMLASALVDMSLESASLKGKDRSDKIELVKKRLELFETERLDDSEVPTVPGAEGITSGLKMYGCMKDLLRLMQDERAEITCTPVYVMLFKSWNSMRGNLSMVNAALAGNRQETGIRHTAKALFETFRRDFGAFFDDKDAQERSHAKYREVVRTGGVASRLNPAFSAAVN